MIKVGVAGCDNLRAAELVRVLINHPDVELGWVTASCKPGTRLDSIVPGIIGECDLEVKHIQDCDDVDIVFIVGDRGAQPDIISRHSLPQDNRVVDLTGIHNLDQGTDKPWVYGMSEMQRRRLVHDASWVTIPGAAAAAALLALIPMARNLLLNSPVTLHVAMGSCAFDDTDNALIDGLAVEQWVNRQVDEVKLALTQCQSSFNQPVQMDLTRISDRRTLAVAARFECGVDAEVVRQLYEQYYEDHNFVFLVDRPIVAADVENTNKCLLRLEKDDRSGTLTVHAVIDVLLKGGAGTAVHVMNLLFGLHERVGLALKGTGC
ncbi:MAG: hypothetical protein IKX56_07125 [Muribaculaceae bacterium]|nr:hypothetical protein [Muribaculaceae bacterium]